jgi:hypothetical protein
MNAIEKIIEDFNLYHVITTDDGTEQYVWKPEVMRDWFRTTLTTLIESMKKEVSDN